MNHGKLQAVIAYDQHVAYSDGAASFGPQPEAVSDDRRLAWVSPDKTTMALKGACFSLVMLPGHAVVVELQLSSWQAPRSGEWASSGTMIHNA